MPPPPTRPAYFKPVIHNQLRRARWHDYHSRCIYMVTITLASGAPPLGYLQNADNPASAFIKPTIEGTIVSNEIIATPAHHPLVKILSFVIMPDHIHILLFVTATIKKPLGSIIQSLKASSTAKIRKATQTARPIFAEGFHDRILSRNGQLEILYRYIADNPRRLAIKRKLPDLFRKYLHLRIGNEEYAAYGNIFLLRDFDKEAVAIHRSWSTSERTTHERRWLACASNGGVLVSPFISRDEKALRERAIEHGARIIQLRAEGFPGRFKPTGRDFGLCESGRLLLLAPWPDNSSRLTMNRAMALTLNRLANDIAAGRTDNAVILPGRHR